MSATPAPSLRVRAERRIGHLVFGSRDWLAARVDEVARTLPAGRVLEIGSGRQDLGLDAYSMAGHFAPEVEFVRSDVDPSFGHLVVDVTTMDFDGEFDAILCLSVLEHVERFWEAVPRLRRALRPGGRLVVSVPMTFPYHDEPADYWRFTAHGLRLLLSDFGDVSVRWRGPRRLPLAVFAVATR